MEHCVLVLADGRTFPGRSFGAEAPTITELQARLDEATAPGADPLLATIGEVVFNTAMSGYVETLTDPSYTGQIIAMTYPHIGNYGVSAEWAESHTDPASSPRPVPAAGCIVRSVYDGPVPDGRQRLTDFLAEAGIPGITGVDTRALTLHLRNHGSKNGLICCPAALRGKNAASQSDAAATLTDEELAQALEILTAFPAMEGRGLISEVGARQRRELPAPTDTGEANGSGERSRPRRGAAQAPHLVLYDCGTKDNIVRELQNLGCRLTLLPSEATADEIREVGADAVMISNGPGDPAVLQHQVEQTRELLGEMPVLGICLGHQIIAEAAGATTSKMKFGHHGVNHPVRDEITRRVFVTSQNHGFTVDETSIPAGLNVWFRNANDQSIEGLRDDARNIRTTQFHPESAPGPTDSRWIFTAFLDAIPGYDAVAARTDPEGPAPDERGRSAQRLRSTLSGKDGT